MEIIEKVSINDIIIGKRARKDLGDLTELKKSIKNRGILHPLCIKRAKEFPPYELIAGRRRLMCAEELRMQFVPCRFFDNLSEIEKKEIELEENLHLELDWKERAQLRKEIHELQQQIHGKATQGHESDGWSLQKTADSIGVSIGTISQDIEILEIAELFPQVKEFKTKKQALRAMKRIKETAILKELAKREKEKDSNNLPYKTYLGDASKCLKQYVRDESIDLVFFDPPFGIDVNESYGPAIDVKLAELDGTLYQDDIESVKILWAEIIPELYRILKQNTHMYVFFPMDYKDIFLKLLGEYFVVRSLPLIWNKKSPSFMGQTKRFGTQYETIFFCIKGKRELNSFSGDVFPYHRPQIGRIHRQQKPLDLLKFLIRLSTVPNEIILDPTMGSGATLVASILTGRRCIGIEKNPNTYNRALGWLSTIKREKE